MFPPKSTCLFLFLLVEVSLQLSFNEFSKAENENLPDYSIIETFLENQSFLNLIYSDDNLNTKAEGVLHNIIKHGSSTPSKTFTINHYDTKNRLNIFVIGSLKHFPMTNILKSRNVYLIISTARETYEKDLQKCFQTFRKRNIFDVYVAKLANNTFEIATFKPFTPENCHDSKPVMVKKSSIQLLQPRALKNFYKCPLRFGAYLNAPYLMNRKNSSSEFNNFFGRDAELIKVLSEDLNFSVYIKTLPFDEINKTMMSLVKNKTDAIIGDLFLRFDRMEISDSSVSYFSSDMTFIVPKGRPFTSLERLAKPFRPSVWYTLAATLMIAMAVIIGIKYQSANVRNFVFGSQNNSPIFNLGLIILGMSQTRLPIRNFARFILMCYIMLCLVIRSLYQGSAYRFLQSNINHESAETIEEMIAEDFEFFMYESSVNILETEAVDKSKVKNFYLEKFEGYMMNITNGSLHKAAFTASRPLSVYLSNMFKYEYKISKKSIINVPIVMYFQKESSLVNVFDIKLGRILNAGLVEFWQRQSTSKKTDRTVVQLKVLSIEHLSGTFQIWLAGCFITFLTFVFELLQIKISRLVNM